jgi:hypothetical protein
MTTNNKFFVKRLVHLKPGVSCTLKRHFDGCIRQVIGYLDLLASNDDDRLVWITTKSILKHCKNYDIKVKGKPTSYSLSMVEKSLNALRQCGIISRQRAVELQERRTFVINHAFVVAPHDALCIKKGSCCRFVGPGAVPGWKWGIADGDIWLLSKSQVVEPTWIFDATERKLSLNISKEKP